jgi:hypothetical protein
MVKRRTKNRTPNPVRSTRYELGGMGSVSVSVSLGMVDILKKQKDDESKEEGGKAVA